MQVNEDGYTLVALTQEMLLFCICKTFCICFASCMRQELFLILPLFYSGPTLILGYGNALNYTCHSVVFQNATSVVHCCLENVQACISFTPAVLPGEKIKTECRKLVKLPPFCLESLLHWGSSKYHICCQNGQDPIKDFCQQDFC